MKQANTTPTAIQYLIEQRVTDGVGFNPIEHYEDTDVGLVKHLASMELVITRRGNVDTIDVIIREFTHMCQVQNTCLVAYLSLLPEKTQKQVLYLIKHRDLIPKSIV